MGQLYHFWNPTTALVFLRAFPRLSLLSYDRRILENARALGINCAAK